MCKGRAWVSESKISGSGFCLCASLCVFVCAPLPCLLLWEPTFGREPDHFLRLSVALSAPPTTVFTHADETWLQQEIRNYFSSITYIYFQKTVTFPVLICRNAFPCKAVGETAKCWTHTWGLIVITILCIDRNNQVFHVSGLQTKQDIVCCFTAQWQLETEQFWFPV